MCRVITSTSLATMTDQGGTLGIEALEDSPEHSTSHSRFSFVSPKSFRAALEQTLDLLQSAVQGVCSQVPGGQFVLMSARSFVFSVFAKLCLLFSCDSLFMWPRRTAAFCGGKWAHTIVLFAQSAHATAHLPTGHGLEDGM